MGGKSVRKGKVYEREVCAEIGERLGIEVERKLGQERDSGNDVDLELATGGNLRMECKRRALIGNVREWLEQAELGCEKELGDIPCIVMRADGWGSSLVVIELADFLGLIEQELMLTKGRP